MIRRGHLIIRRDPMRLTKLNVISTLILLCGGAFAEHPRATNADDPFSVWKLSQQTQLQLQLDYIDRLKKGLAAEPDDLGLQMNLGRAYYWLALDRDGKALIEA